VQAGVQLAAGLSGGDWDTRDYARILFFIASSPFGAVARDLLEAEVPSSTLVSVSMRYQIPPSDTQAIRPCRRRCRKKTC
jgi:hypothetical protein